MIKLSPTLLALALVAAPGVAQTNLLTNGNFDDPTNALAGWGAFGNAFGEASNAPAIVPRSDPNVAKLFGNFTGGFDVSGIFQEFNANPGDTFTLDCWSRHFSGDALTGNGPDQDNWMVQKIAFFDAGGNEITAAAAEGIILTGASPQDVWINNTPISGTAPVGATKVQALILFLQPANAGGSGQVDDVEFFGPPPQQPTYPGTGADLLLATGIGGAPPSSGAGNDVKQAGGNQVLEIAVSSPNGGLDLQNYYVLGQAFATGNPPPQTLPGVWFSFGSPITTLVGSIGGPIRGPVIPPGGSSSTFFVTPSGMAGTSIMLQAVAFPTATTFGTSDGHEIQLQ